MENPLSISSLLGLFNLCILDRVATFSDIPIRTSTFLATFFFKTIINIGLTDSKYIAGLYPQPSPFTFITAGLSCKWKHTYFRKLVCPCLPQWVLSKIECALGLCGWNTSASPRLNRKNLTHIINNVSQGKKVDLSVSALGLASRWVITFIYRFCWATSDIPRLGLIRK